MGEKALLDLLKDADVAAEASSEDSEGCSEVSHSCVVMGPAGAGKTTLVNVLGGVDFPTGPQASDRTLEAQSCDLKLQDVGTVVLIDTPGWSPDTSVDIESEYQQVLKEKKLVSEHAPHIVLFCVSASNIRQFQHEDAKKMGGQLIALKFDQRFCIKVLPIVTFADTQAENDLKKIMPEIKQLVETVFEQTRSTVEEPVFTMVPPNGEAQGVEEVKGRLRKMLLEQVQSDNFSRLWRLALAKSIVSETKEHAKKFPENESSFRLWKRAFCTVAAGCGKEISDLEEFEEITAALVKCDQVEEFPWWTISLIPRSQTETWLPPFSYQASCFRKWLAPFLLIVMVIVLLFSTLHTWDMEARFDQMSHGLEEAKANETKVKNENKALRGEYGKMYSCSWTPQPGQCMGLSQLDRVWTAKDCREVCCRMGPEICSTWQFDGKSSECWLGTPTDCSDDDDGWAGGRLSSA